MDNTKKQKMTIAEDSFQLRLSKLGKKLLHLEPSPNQRIVKNGNIVLTNGSAKIYLSYSIDFSGQKNIFLHFSRNPTDSDKINIQEIEIIESAVHFGLRPYFLCECGQKATILYLPNDKSTKFKCRSCQNITYAICNINRTTAGGVLYGMNRVNKLMEKRERITRSVYAGKPTRDVIKIINKFNELNKNMGSNQDKYKNILKSFAT